MNWTAYIALLLSAFLGGMIGLALDRKRSKQYLGFILPFSGSFLLGVAILHLLPELYLGSEGDHTLGIYILCGFLIQIILEFLSKGVEHGHVHVKKGQNKSYLFSIMFGLCAHAFLEGMPVVTFNEAHAGHDHSFLTQPYLWGIVAHKLPAATALSILLLASEVKKRNMFILLFIFGIMSPLGAFLASFMELGPMFQKVILGLALGSIMHIATIIIFETDSNPNHNLSYKKVVAVLMGFAIAFLSLL